MQRTLQQEFRKTARTKPLFLETRGSVWSSTKLPIACFSLYAVVIYALNNAGLAPNFGRGASSLSAVLSMTVGLMLSYRSSSSSERWHNGRQIFASLTSSVRTLTTLLYLALPPPSSRSTGWNAQHQTAVDDLLNLIIAYCYAFKNHLRDQDPLKDPAFRELLSKELLASFESTPHSSRTIEKNGTSSDERFDKVINDNTPTAAPRRAQATKLGGPKNMPLCILRNIQSLLNSFHATAAPTAGAPAADSPMLDSPTWGNCIAIIKEMTDQLSQAERIRDTPIPMALGIHVSQMLVLHCLSIPPQLVGVLGIWVVPVSAIVAWTFWGVDSAAAQLSDPFGTDVNDLPTDKFVRNIHDEYLELVGSGAMSGSNANDSFLTLPASVGSKDVKSE
ncbi:UPF0187-domain-containing protein [Cystobasidium minutum MCA 4210]|uniref:UPF0187-domain-containing protein n=1 Tax=Cystobasidium minutum MCA 4210 TaxID=1397322 RepID=UPI0034CD80AA|eukprot:jgi/Rhomi1/185203/estExt_fgenesh1_pm.C_20213